MDIKTMRRNNLTRLLERFGTQKALADATGLDPGHISQMHTGHRAVGDRIARKLEAALNLPHGWMDTPQIAVRQDPSAYDIVAEAEIAEAVDRFRNLDHAFRQYILLKMRELALYSNSLSPFLRKRIQPPTGANFTEWESEILPDIKRTRRDEPTSHET